MRARSARRWMGWGAIAAVSGLAACAPPQLIQDYTVRDHELFFVVQEGRAYAVGECKRAPAGELRDCKMYQPEFR